MPTWHLFPQFLVGEAWAYLIHNPHTPSPTSPCNIVKLKNSEKSWEWKCILQVHCRGCPYTILWCYFQCSFIVLENINSVSSCTIGLTLQLCTWRAASWQWHVWPVELGKSAAAHSALYSRFCGRKINLVSEVHFVHGLASFFITR